MSVQEIIKWSWIAILTTMNPFAAVLALWATDEED
jgi:hypothetical protein